MGVQPIGAKTLSCPLRMKRRTVATRDVNRNLAAYLTQALHPESAQHQHHGEPRL